MAALEWTAEKIAALTTQQIKDLKINAEKKGAAVVLALCDDELTRRKPAPKRSTKLHSRKGHYVSCFHFICPKENEVIRNSGGTIWSGTWVVSEENAETSLRYGGKVALHTSKAEPSYLQGVIKGWRKSPRKNEYADGIKVKTSHGIDFLLEPFNQQLLWVGDATGEKGYDWSETSEDNPPGDGAQLPPTD